MSEEDIAKKLYSIDRRLERMEKGSERQLGFSIGFGGVAIGTGMVISGVSLSKNIYILVGALIFVLGASVMMISALKKTI